MITTKQATRKSNSAYIVYVNPQTQKEKTLEVGGNKSEFVIGRGSFCDLVVSNPVISRTHCIIKYGGDDENEKWIIFDKSSSGTYVNKEQITSGGSRLLKSDDTITLSGPYSYPLYFYTRDTFMLKRKKPVQDICSVSNKRIKNGKENVVKNSNKEKICSPLVISLCSEEDDCVGRHGKVGSKCDDDDGFVVSNSENNDKIKIKKSCNDYNKMNCETSHENDNIIRKEEKPSNDSISISPESEKLKCLMDEKSKLVEQALSDAKEIQDLELEVQVLECRIKLNNDTINNLKCELNEAKSALIAKDDELKMMEGRLLVAEQNEIKEDDIKNEVILKVNEDIMELLENELQCSICNEVIIEATVLNCTHLFCFFCISTWMKKKKECAVCRAHVKDVIKARALDSFIDKLLQKYTSIETLEHRKQIVEERIKEKTPNRPHRHQRGQGRNGRGGGREQTARQQNHQHHHQQQQPYVFNVAIPQPPNLVHIVNRIGPYIPEMEHLPADLAEDLNDINDELIAGNELMNELLPIINLTNDAIDLRINRRLRRGRRGQQTARHQPREVNVIDLRDSPDRE